MGPTRPSTSVCTRAHLLGTDTRRSVNSSTRGSGHPPTHTYQPTCSAVLALASQSMLSAALCTATASLTALLAPATTPPDSSATALYVGFRGYLGAEQGGEGSTELLLSLLLLLLLLQLPI